jgi:hypothetical protein
VLVPLLPAVILAAHLGTITTVAWVMTASMVMTWVAVAIAADRRVGMSVRDQWHVLRPVLLACPVAWGATRGAAELTMGSTSALVSLAASSLAGLLAYLAVVALADPGLPRHALGQLRRVISRAPAIVDREPLSGDAAPEDLAGSRVG